MLPDVLRFVLVIALIASCAPEVDGSSRLDEGVEDSGRDPRLLAQVWDPANACGVQELRPMHPNVLIVLDRSPGPDNRNAGSDRWYSSLTALRAVVADRREAASFGVITFPSGGEEGCSPGKLDVPFDIDNPLDLIPRLPPPSIAGYSPLASTLEVALRTFDSCTGCNSGPRHVLLITDGRPNCAANPIGDAATEAVAETLASIDRLRAHGIRLSVLGYDSSPDLASALVLSRFAQHGGTERWNPASDEATMTAALQRIADSLVSCRYTLPSPITDLAKASIVLDDRSIDPAEWSTDGLQITLGAACERLHDGRAHHVSLSVPCPPPAPTVHQLTWSSNRPDLVTARVEDAPGEWLRCEDNPCPIYNGERVVLATLEDDLGRWPARFDCRSTRSESHEADGFDIELPDMRSDWHCEVTVATRLAWSANMPGLVDGFFHGVGTAPDDWPQCRESPCYALSADELAITTKWEGSERRSAHFWCASSGDEEREEDGTELKLPAGVNDWYCDVNVPTRLAWSSNALDRVDGLRWVDGHWEKCTENPCWFNNGEQASLFINSNPQSAIFLCNRGSPTARSAFGAQIILPAWNIDWRCSVAVGAPSQPAEAPRLPRYTITWAGLENGFPADGIFVDLVWGGECDSSTCQVDEGGEVRLVAPGHAPFSCINLATGAVLNTGWLANIGGNYYCIAEWTSNVI